MRDELTRKWKPWGKSTGPKTAEGKARVSRNADKGGAREMLREIGRILRKQKAHIVRLDEFSAERNDVFKATVQDARNEQGAKR